MPATTATYFKPSPEKLKKEYMKVVDKVSISKVDVYDVKSEEFAHLEETNKTLEKRLERLESEFKIELDLKKRHEQLSKNHR